MTTNLKYKLKLSVAEEEKSRGFDFAVIDQDTNATLELWPTDFDHADTYSTLEEAQSMAKNINDRSIPHFTLYAHEEYYVIEIVPFETIIHETIPYVHEGSE